ncbi:MAG: hypothetical protein OEX03_06770 [Gammaproteobacteria bacterium]|nr:hypothetical protein [Gammaproteobacteria bacterium]
MITTIPTSSTYRAGSSPARANRMGHYEKVVVITRETQLEALVRRFNTRKQAQFYLQHSGQDFAPIELEHQRYQEALEVVRSVIPLGVKSQHIERSMIPQFTFGDDDFVITIGPDGLVVNTAKYLKHQPIMAINPDPDCIDGVLLPFTVKDIEQNMKSALQGGASLKAITMANASMNTGQELLAFNDLFVGPSSHISARYEIRQGERYEQQSSSGIIISTGAGSTGWLKSIFAGAVGVVNALGGQVTMPVQNGRFDWSDEQLVYAVREPWPSKASSAGMVFGTITRDRPLELTSNMAETGVIFSDGFEKDYLDFNAGHSVKIGLADHKAHLVMSR